MYIQGIFPIGSGYAKGLIAEVFLVCTREYVQAVCQRECPMYIQGNITRFYVQAHMSKEVVQAGMTKRVCSVNVLACISKGYFLLEVVMQRSISRGLFGCMHKGVCSGRMSKRLSKVCSREYDYVLCSSSYV